MRGLHCIRHWSQTQPTIALSSGEAELGGLAKGIAQGMGLRSIAADLGIDLPLTLRTDATAAMGMARRLGIGKIRHLDTSLLWVQDKVRSGDVSMEKVAGAENPGDAMTKHLAGPELKQHVARMGLYFEEGRAESAPQLAASLQASADGDKEVLRAERKRIMALRQAGTEQKRRQTHQQRQKIQSIRAGPCAQEVSSLAHIQCNGCGTLQPRTSSHCRVCEDPIPRRP